MKIQAKLDYFANPKRKILRFDWAISPFNVYFVKVNLRVKFEIVELDGFSGVKAKIYSIIPFEGDNLSEDTLFDEFLMQYEDEYLEEVEDIEDALRTMGQNTGLRGNRVISAEGEQHGDGIVAICNRPGKLLRLYGIFIGDCLAIIGGGGIKDGGGALQHYPALRKANDRIKVIKKIIDAAIEQGDIHLTQNGLESVTDFILNGSDYE